MKTPKGLPGYGASEVAAFTGISDTNIQAWLQRQLLPCVVVPHGKRTYRRFGAKEMQTIAVMGALYEQGFEPSVARDFADRINAFVETPSEPGFPQFLVLTRTKMVRADDTDALVNVRGLIGSDLFLAIDAKSLLQTRLNVFARLRSAAAKETK
jgi:hypothetical protein